MKVSTDALVIREQHTGENDRIVTLLTRDFGLIRAFATGSRKINNRNHAATQMLSYGKFVLYKTKDAWRVGEADPIATFFELRDDIKKLSLAQYFCEVAKVLTPEEDNSEEYLRLVLNCLQLTANDKYNQTIIKAVFELYILSLSGYMPELNLCNRCGAEDGEFVLDCAEGVLLCRQHIPVLYERYAPLSKGALTAMRYILSSELKNAFNFTLSDESLSLLKSTCETYLKTQTERSFKTLDFYNSL
ncbi:MAG: DNA repair protein RecO [Clostridia bacterium]|nr:DNA repair protein RecO [Clostridia bacterium]